jgi:hypothetical protein
MAEITFHANNFEGGGTSEIGHTIGSGLGFYGAGYGVSVPVASRQNSTWVTNADGTASMGVYQLNNTELEDLDNVGDVDANDMGKVSSNGLTEIDLNLLPNYLAPLNIKFTHTEDVKVQNCKLRIFDRNNILKHASGVTTFVYEVRHPHLSQVAGTNVGLSHRGHGGNYHEWTEYDSEDSSEPADMIFTNSPGLSGCNSTTADEGVAGGITDKFPAAALTSPQIATFAGNLHDAAQHDWYAALSAMPTEIGSKTKYGLYFTLEYL